MSENNEKILKRAAITEEEAGQVAGGRGKWGMDTPNTSMKCDFCGSTEHKSEECPNPGFLFGN